MCLVSEKCAWFLDVIEAGGERSGGLGFLHFVVDRYRRHTFPVWVLSSEFIMSSISGWYNWYNYTQFEVCVTLNYKEHNAGARGIKMITSSRRAG